VAENVKEIIASNLASLRREHKLTQQQLAEKLNYSDKAVSRWENAETLPDI
jgi:transcriptional regulator with XRE-family HTH domain